MIKKVLSYLYFLSRDFDNLAFRRSHCVDANKVSPIPIVYVVHKDMVV